MRDSALCLTQAQAWRGACTRRCWSCAATTRGGPSPGSPSRSPRAAGARGTRGQFALLLRVAPVVRVPGAPWQPRVYTWCTCLATARTAPGVAGQAAARDLFSSMPLQILQCDEVCAQQDADAQQPARRLLANRVRNSSAHTRCRVCGVRAHRMPRCTRTGTSCIDMRRMTSITATPAAVAVAPHAAASGWCSTLSR